ncbi:uncharacterized protein LOC111106146 isoform X2 [Crassostrea virginica]
MYFVNLNVFLLSFLSIIVQCDLTMPSGFSKIQWNHREKEETFMELEGLNFIDCVEQCLLRNRCFSVNYLRRKLHCELNSEAVQYYNQSNVIFNEDPSGYIYSHMSDWDANIVGKCANHNCGLNERCVVSKAKAEQKCELSDCGFVPVFLNADSVTNEKDTYIGIGSRLTFKLTETLLSEPKDRDFEMICQNDGVWSSSLTANSSDEAECSFLNQQAIIETLQLGSEFVRIPVIKEDGQKWVLIQRRCTGTVDFNRTMNEYKGGFGSLNSEFWIVEALSYFNGMMFSTWDEDRDYSTTSCAEKNGGGWWFRECHQANPNGAYGVHETWGISWLMTNNQWIYPSHIVLMVGKS